MSISINRRTSGFRKWAEAHRQNGDTRAGAMEDCGITVADPGQGGKISDQPPHRPWLVPGIGKL
jgi:hypothetical protein